MSAYISYYATALTSSINNYDLVHANYGLSGPPALLQPCHPVVITFWGSDVTGSISQLSQICARYADAVVVMSDEMADLLNVDCYVVPHGVDLEQFRPVPQSQAREKVEWNSDAYQVLFPYGPAREVKDFPRAQRIVERARSRLEQPVELRTMSGVPHDHVHWYMNAADALILTSKREGSPNTVKEALACNLPVIATDVGDVSDRLDDVTYSTASSDNDVLVEALSDTLRASERSNGREVVADLGVENQITKIEAVYESVV